MPKILFPFFLSKAYQLSHKSVVFLEVISAHEQVPEKVTCETQNTKH